MIRIWFAWCHSFPHNEKFQPFIGDYKMAVTSTKNAFYRTRLVMCSIEIRVRTERSISNNCIQIFLSGICLWSPILNDTALVGLFWQMHAVDVSTFSMSFTFERNGTTRTDLWEIYFVEHNGQIIINHVWRVSCSPPHFLPWTRNLLS